MLTPSPSGTRPPLAALANTAWQQVLGMLVLSGIFFIGLLWNIATAHAATPEKHAKPLQFGILPFLPTATLMTHYTPLKTYLEHALAREIIISTAPNYREYIRRTSTNEYDFLLTAPHFAKFAEEQHGFVSLARLQGTLKGIFLVAKTSPYQTITDLRNKTLVVRDNLALPTLLGEQLLATVGIRPGNDIHFSYSPSYTSAALSVVRGTADAALINERGLRTLSSEEIKNLRILAHTKSFPNFIFMANPRLGTNEIVRLRDALLNFSNDEENSTAFLQNMDHNRIDRITKKTLRFLAPYVTILQQRLPQE